MPASAPASRRIRRRAADREPIVCAALRSVAAIDGMAVVAECPDEGVEFGDRLFALAPGELDLVGQLLELLEGRPLIEWLRFWVSLVTVIE